MAPKPPSADDPTHAQTDESGLKKLAGDPQAAPPSAADAEKEEDEDLELDDDEEDEDLVVFTAREAAGAFATIYGFVRPYFGNYRKLIVFVSFGVIVETLFNVIMPLSLKFL